MSIQFSQQGMAALPASFARPRSSFVRRLLRAGDKFVGAARGRCSAYAGRCRPLKTIGSCLATCGVFSDR
jgi:hypothetical protein